MDFVQEKFSSHVPWSFLHSQESMDNWIAIFWHSDKMCQFYLTKQMRLILAQLYLTVERYFLRNVCVDLHYVVIYLIRKNKRSFKHRWQRRRRKRSARKKRMTQRVKWRRKRKISAHLRSVEGIVVGIVIETGKRT